MSTNSAATKADRLFGQVALKLGAVTREQLDKALELQRTSRDHKTLGSLLLQLKVITTKDLNRIVEEQKALVAAAKDRIKAVKEDNLFGKVAIRLNLTNEEKLAQCLAIQDQLPKDRFMRLGDIMVIKGFLTVEQVRQIVDTQRGLILYCPKCDTQYNVVMFKPGASLQCYKCGSPLRIPLRATSSRMDEALYFGDE